MASTNKTANYDLSQYVGSDKPTYLGDYNADMLKIDTAMKANNTLASNASTTANTANETAGTALTNAGNAQTTADNAMTTATSALGKATTNEANIANFNLSVFESATNVNTNIGTIDNSRTNISVAKNSDGSLAKIYGRARIDFTNPSGAYHISFATSLRPKTQITINTLVMSRLLTSGGQQIYMTDLTIGTDGTCTMSDINVYSTITTGDVWILPCLLFIKDFGDVPTPDA